MQRSKKDSPRTKKEPAKTKTALRVERAQIPVSHNGAAFGPEHQIFIAKLKRGEVWALNQLSFNAKGMITPLFEMWPPKKGTQKKPAKSLAAHTTDLMQTVAAEWKGLPCFMDTQYLRSAGVPSPQAVLTVFNAARTEQVEAIPVTSPYFAQPFQEAIRNVIQADGRGVMFRLPLNLFNDLQNLPGYLDGLANFLGIGRNQVDILVDLAYRPNVIEVQQLGASCLNSLPFIDDWRTVSLASGCFPDSISTLQTGPWIELNRADWNGWLTVASQRATAKSRVPTYADYGVRSGGEPLDIPNTPAPNLRYTDQQKIWVRRGPKAPGAMRTICQNLITQPYYSGPTFSLGDAEIAAKAANSGPKNAGAEQWIQWCTNHHLELTASQIQNLPFA